MCTDDEKRVQCAKHIDRETERDGETERDTQSEFETDRERQRQREREKESERDRERERQRQRERQSEGASLRLPWCPPAMAPRMINEPSESNQGLVESSEANR